MKIIWIFLSLLYKLSKKYNKWFKEKARVCKDGCKNCKHYLCRLNKR